MTLAVCQDMLIVAGYFSSVGGGIPAHSIAGWDGAMWRVLGSGIGSGAMFDYQYVFDVTEHGDGIVAGGNFFTAGGAPAGRIARWDGEQWTTLGSGTTGDVYAVAFGAGRLFAGGGFHNAGGVPCGHIASWDGESWGALGSGVNDDVAVGGLLWHNECLFVGGEFVVAGGSPSWHIARWLGAGTGAEAVAESSMTPGAWLGCPSPYRAGQQITLAASLGTPLEVAIYSVNGRLERVLFHGAWNGGRVVWDGRTQNGATAEAGIYFCRARAAGWEISRKVLRVR